MRYVFSGSEPTATGVIVNPGDSLLVTAGATLANLASNNSFLLRVSGGFVQNEGTIRETGTGVCVGLREGGSILNNGTIEYRALDTGTPSGAILLGTAGAGTTYSSSVVNAGTIIAHQADAIQVRVNHLSVTNTGTISADNGYYAINLYSEAQRPGTDAQLRLVNKGFIVGTIRAINSNDQYISNDGVITGSIGLGGGSNTVISKGVIDGDIVLVGNNHVDIAGSVSGGIVFGDGHSDFTNSGTVAFDVWFGSSNDIVHNTGSVGGGLLLGGGDDVYDGTGGSVGTNVIGGQGNDYITGGSGNDTIYGDNASGDTSGGSDTIYGGAGDDALFGGYGTDNLFGNQGNDTIYGNQGDDYIHGGQGSDTIYGGQGNDIVIGGVGNDILNGNLGDDLFVFSANNGHDTVFDFSTVGGNNDVIQFQVGTFSSYADVQSHMTQQGDNVVIAMDTANDIILNHVTLAQLTADHFIFG